jgi:hypothetical protein
MGEGSAGDSSATFQWTCCNPTCESLQQQQQQQQQHPAAPPLFEEKVVLEGKRKRTPCRHMEDFASEAELAEYEAVTGDQQQQQQQQEDEQLDLLKASKRDHTGLRRRSQQQSQQEEESEEEGAEGEGPGAGADERGGTHGSQLFCQPGAGALELKLLLPQDLACDTDRAAGLLKQLRAAQEVRNKPGCLQDVPPTSCTCHLMPSNDSSSTAWLTPTCVHQPCHAVLRDISHALM